MKSPFFRIIAVALFNLFTILASAQSWEEYQSWFQYGDGMERLASFAHPTSDFVRASVESFSSSRMIVRIVFHSFTLGNYTGKFEIIKGYYSGVEYIKNVSVLSDEALVPPFSAWSKFNDGYAALFRKLKNNDWPVEDLYGETSFYELSGGKKAAFALWAIWLERNM